MGYYSTNAVLRWMLLKEKHSSAVRELSVYWVYEEFCAYLFHELCNSIRLMKSGLSEWLPQIAQNLYLPPFRPWLIVLDFRALLSE